MRADLRECVTPAAASVVSVVRAGLARHPIVPAGRYAVRLDHTAVCPAAACLRSAWKRSANRYAAKGSSTRRHSHRRLSREPLSAPIADFSNVPAKQTPPPAPRWRDGIQGQERLGATGGPRPARQQTTCTSAGQAHTLGYYRAGQGPTPTSWASMGSRPCHRTGTGLPPRDRNSDRNEQHRAALGHHLANTAWPRRAGRSGLCLHLLSQGC